MGKSIENLVCGKLAKLTWPPVHQYSSASNTSVYSNNRLSTSTIGSIVIQRICIRLNASSVDVILCIVVVWSFFRSIAVDDDHDDVDDNEFASFASFSSCRGIRVPSSGSINNEIYDSVVNEDEQSRIFC